MIAQELTCRIREHLRHVPTPEQEVAINLFAAFATHPRENSAMILRGSAGTGKTSLAAAVVGALLSLKQRLVLLAPTGRAAKVFSLYARHPAYTIHRRIYRQQTAADLSAFRLNDNLHRDTLFIIDEASMISARHADSTFGTGCLLDDLVAYVYGGQNCRMMLVGDRAQLPPVGEQQAPALCADVLRGYGLAVCETDLCQVVRQERASGILWNATAVRRMIDEADAPTALPRLRLARFPDIVSVRGDELIEALHQSYASVGLDEAMVVTRSNKRAIVYNRGIRNQVLDREEELCRGDQLMIVKNNYYWVKDLAAGEGDNGLLPTFLANGDRCVVQRVRRNRELYGLRFADVTIQLPDYDDLELTATVLLDTLLSEAPALTHEQQELLFANVVADYADLPTKGERMKALKNDPHYNALQVKYGYAVTCHKAQGGQWAHVYIDQGYMADDMLGSDYLHWLYTALTRATEKVFLVNWPDKQVADD